MIGDDRSIEQAAHDFAITHKDRIMGKLILY